VGEGSEVELGASGAAVPMTPIRSTGRWTWSAIVLVAVLLGVAVGVSGFVVWTEYVPSAARAMCDDTPIEMCGPDSGRPPEIRAWWAALSATGTLALVVTVWAVVRGVRALGDRARRRRSLRAAVAAIGALTASAVAGAMAGTLAWDQLALWGVADARRPMPSRGLGWLFDERATDQVRLVLTGGAEIGVGTMQRHAVLTIVTVIATFALLGLALWLLRPEPPVAAEVRPDHDLDR
jgi:hypothetical protein